MIVVTARIVITAGHEEAFIAAVRDVIERTLAEEPGCLAYGCSRDILDSAEFVFVEEWDDIAAVRAHTATDHYRAYAAVAKRSVAAQVIKVHTVRETRIC